MRAGSSNFLLVILSLMIAGTAMLPCVARDINRIQNAQQGSQQAAAERQKERQSQAARRQQLIGWVNQYMTEVENDPVYGGTIRMGNRFIFSQMLSKPELDVNFVRGLQAKRSVFGRFLEPGARRFGIAQLIPDSMNSYNSCIEVDSEQGTRPNRTIWHESIHAVIYLKGWRDHPCMGKTNHEKFEREEAFTWLMEERLDFLERFKTFAQEYETAKNETDRARRIPLVMAVNKRLPSFPLNWKNANLIEGPARYMDLNVEMDTACVREFEKLLGISFDFNRMMREKYPPLKIDPDVAGDPKGGVWIRQNPNFRFRHSIVDMQKKTVFCPVSAGRGTAYAPVWISFTEPPPVILRGDTVTLNLALSKNGRGWATTGQAGWNASGWRMGTFDTQPRAVLESGIPQSGGQFKVDFPTDAAIAMPPNLPIVDATIRMSWVCNSTNEDISWTYKFSRNPTHGELQYSASPTSSLPTGVPPERLNPPSVSSVGGSPPTQAPVSPTVQMPSRLNPPSNIPSVSPGGPAGLPPERLDPPSVTSVAPSPLNATPSPPRQNFTLNNSLGDLLNPGGGPSMTPVEAAANQLLQQAEQGDAKAQFKVGLWMEKSKRFADALVWYERAAQQGNAEAQNNLGTLIYNGRGCKPDYKTAAYWLSKAAEQGLPQGLASMGSLYYYGVGVPKNERKGIALLRAGARKGNPKAIEKLNQLGISINGEDD